MDAFTCTRPFFQDEGDKEEFIEHYVEWMQAQFISKEIFVHAHIVKAIPENGDTRHHQSLGLEIVMSNVFNRLSKADKRSLAEVCKRWAEMFLVGTETSKVLVDYNRQLVSGNVCGLITVQRGQKVVKMFCVCRAYPTKEAKYEVHRLLEKAHPVVEDFPMWPEDNSGSDGYYDSDC